METKTHMYIPLAHSVTMKETSDNLTMILNGVKYEIGKAEISTAICITS